MATPLSAKRLKNNQLVSRNFLFKARDIARGRSGIPRCVWHALEGGCDTLKLWEIVEISDWKIVEVSRLETSPLGRAPSSPCPVLPCWWQFAFKGTLGSPSSLFFKIFPSLSMGPLYLAALHSCCLAAYTSPWPSRSRGLRGKGVYFPFPLLLAHPPSSPKQKPGWPSKGGDLRIRRNQLPLCKIMFSMFSMQPASQPERTS